MTHTNQAALIVPLYQYPITEKTWEPLYTAISTFSTLNFVIIVNINSGPGVDFAGWLPDKHYRREIPRLNAFPNVTLVGYVRIDYCRRSIADVRLDLRKYSNWSGNMANIEADTHCHLYERSEFESQSCLTGKPEMAMHGIFFDEVPNLYSDDVAEYLIMINREVKSSRGLLGRRLVIHNPGTVPDPEFASLWHNPANDLEHLCQNGSLFSRLQCSFGESLEATGPDVIVVFEESNDLWLSSASQTRLAELLSYRRDHCCYMVHSVPSDMVSKLTRELKLRGAHLFVTDLCAAYYQSFGNCWWEFLEALSTDQNSN